MTEFERGLVKAFNRYFREDGIRGIAYRRKQHRFSSQFVDVLVDSFNPDFYLAIENKSIKTSSAKKLYFTQHFSTSEDGHQVERIENFLRKSGRRGFLAVELRRGRGKSRKAFMVPWTEVFEEYSSGGNGITVNKIKEYPEIERVGENYSIQKALEIINENPE